MRLKISNLTLDQQLWEFDLWVTPALTDIRGTDRFKDELRRVLAVLNALTSGGGDNNLSPERYSASLVERAFRHLDILTANSRDAIEAVNEAEEFLNSLAALLFLVTGKSDNNNKCQFPIYLRNKVGIGSLPNIRMRKGKAYLVQDEIPRVLDSEAYMTRIARLYAHRRLGFHELQQHDYAQSLLLEFASLLLSDAASRAQLSAFLKHYRTSNANGEDASVLLTPLVIFQVRGSVAASGGHEPEEILRRYMQTWGMVREVDFNVNDVVLDVEAGRLVESESNSEEPSVGKTKTRAYDFVLPFRRLGWTPQIFIQSQFYAGDSGSVSHKNVDQTSSSRLNATKLLAKAWPEGAPPRFLEYVDGAGYSASLNGDLKSLLSFSDTAGFFQIRSAPIRLRRELQQVGFLTPLEVAHATLLSGNASAAVIARLQEDGYSAEEVNRGLAVAVETGFIDKTGDSMTVTSSHLPVARLYMLLDLIARAGHNFDNLSSIVGVALVPGYGPYHGLTLAELDIEVRARCPTLWSDGYMSDLQQLCTDGWVVLR